MACAKPAWLTNVPSRSAKDPPGNTNCAQLRGGRRQDVLHDQQLQAPQHRRLLGGKPRVRIAAAEVERVDLARRHLGQHFVLRRDPAGEVLHRSLPRRGGWGTSPPGSRTSPAPAAGRARPSGSGRPRPPAAPGPAPNAPRATGCGGTWPPGTPPRKSSRATARPPRRPAARRRLRSARRGVRTAPPANPSPRPGRRCDTAAASAARRGGCSGSRTGPRRT